MEIKIIMESSDPELVTGTTCANCKYTKDQVSAPVSKKDLNKFGGISPESDTDKKNALNADVITMPGKRFPKEKHMCSNPLVLQWVTERMCCNLWDHPGLVRDFKGKEPEL